MQTYEISIIMPCFNEESNIEDAVKSTLNIIDHNNILGEIIIVNDGSIDKSRLIIKKLLLKDKRLKLINHKKNYGIGKSFKDGVAKAKYAYCAMIPGDNENSPLELLRYLFLTNEVDIIVPFIHNLEIRSKVRRIISSFYRFLINVTFGTNFNYTNGTVIYKTSIIKNLKLCSFGFFYQAEILIRLVRKGYLFAEVPQLLQVRNSGKSKALTISSFIEVCGAFLVLFWNIHIKRSESNNNLLDNTSVTVLRKNNAS